MANSNRRGMNPVLAFFLGFLLAIVLIGGTIGIAVAVVLNYKIDKISANKDSEGNYIFINADADNGGASTVLDLVKKISALSKDYKNLTLGEAKELMPVLGKLTDKLNDALSDFVALEENEIEDQKIGELETFVKGLAERIDVARLIGARADNEILVYLCYGVYKLDYNPETGIYSGKYKDDSGNVYDCTLKVGADGKVSGAEYVVDEVVCHTPALTLDIVNDRVNGVCNDLTIGEIVDIGEDDKIFGSIKNSTINTISKDVNKICVQQLFPDDIYAAENPKDEEKSPEAKMYLAVDGTPAQATVYDSDLIYYVKDGENYVLAATNGKIKQEDFAAGLSENKYYTYGEGKIGFDARFVYYEKDEDGSYVMYKDEAGEHLGKISSLSPDKEYYTYGGTSALWKLLLYTAEGEAQQETVYNFENINSMITNVTKNTKNTSMRELHAAGILTFDKPEELETDVVWNDSEGSHRETLGDMTLSELVGVVVHIFKNMPSVPETP